MNKQMALGVIAVNLLVGTVLAGCSGGQTTNNPGGASPQSSGKQQGSTSMSFYDRGSISPEAGTAENNLWTKYIAEQTGTTLKVSPIPRGESVQKFNTLFASGSAPDIVLEYDGGFRNQLYTQKQIMPIGDLIDKNSTVYKDLLVKFPLLKKIGTHEDGKLYDFGRVLGYVPYHFVVVREDWLKKMNQKVPTTTEELYELAKLFATQDPDGNGKKDTFGLNLSTTAPGSDSWIDYMFQNVEWIIQDGKWVKDWDRAEAATTFRKKLFDEGIVDKDFLTDKNGKKAEQDFVTGKTGIYGAAGSIKTFYTLYETLRKNVPDAKLIPIVLPKSQFGQFSPPFNPPVQLTGALNAQTKDPQAAIKVVDYLSSKEWIKTTYSGKEGVHYKLENGKEVPIDKDKNKKELDWTGDFRMLGGQFVYNEFDTQTKAMDQSKPFDKEVFDLSQQIFKMYITKDRPLANITLTAYFPILPSDIQFISKSLYDNGGPIKDLWNKAIVSGSSYTPQQAKQDAQNLWKKSEGTKLEAWYQDWYAKNKDTMVNQNDLLNMNFK